MPRILETALLAKAVSNSGGSAAPKTQPSSFSESIAQKPLQWLVVFGAIAYFGSKALKGAATGLANKNLRSAETDTSVDNPFSFNTFLSQKIPANTKMLNSAGAYKYAKQVYDALNVYTSEDEDVAIAAITSLPSKLQVAQVCKAFNDYFKRDIIAYLKEGKVTFDVGQGGLDSTQLKRIFDNVNKKPKF